MASTNCCGFVRVRARTHVCVQRYILPRMFNIADPETERWRRINEQMNELRDSIKFVMDSVQQTLTAVQRREVDVSGARTCAHSHNACSDVVKCRPCTQRSRDGRANGEKSNAKS